MKYFDAFTGIGGFTLGINQAYDNRPNIRNGAKDIREHLTHTAEPQNRFTCVGYSEIDKYASSIYAHNFPTHHNYGDITTINAEELPDFDLLVGGFPCQAFSIAGKRRGFEDTRGTLFFELARILRAKQPRLFVFENVKGLLSHDNGNTFKTIISTITELGYDCQWQVLNSKNFGVPQNRERVFIVGHLRGTSRPEVFPVRNYTKEINELQGQYSNTLTSRYYGGQANGTYILESQLNAQEIKQLNNPKHSNDRVYNPNGISPTLNTMQGGNRQPFIGKDTTIRRLTPTECERLQGFPDDWTASVSDTQRYKCLGNAVTVPVVQHIIYLLQFQSRRNPMNS